MTLRLVLRLLVQPAAFARLLNHHAGCSNPPSLPPTKLGKLVCPPTLLGAEKFQPRRLFQLCSTTVHMMLLHSLPRHRVQIPTLIDWKGLHRRLGFQVVYATKLHHDASCPLDVASSIRHPHSLLGTISLPVALFTFFRTMIGRGVLSVVMRFLAVHPLAYLIYLTRVGVS